MYVAFIYFKKLYLSLISVFCEIKVTPMNLRDILLDQLDQTRSLERYNLIKACKALTYINMIRLVVYLL